MDILRSKWLLKIEKLLNVLSKSKTVTPTLEALHYLCIMVSVSNVSLDINDGQENVLDLTVIRMDNSAQAVPQAIDITSVDVWLILFQIVPFTKKKTVSFATNSTI